MQLFGRLWQRIQDLPRHLGQHSGGMVISHGRLDDVVPLENASMPGRVVIQWDKDDCADMGLIKVDLLGLGMMAVIQDALELVNKHAVVRDPQSVVRKDLSAFPDTKPREPQMGNAAAGDVQDSQLRSPIDRDLADGPGIDSTNCPSIAGPRTTDHGPRTREPAELDLAHLPPNDPAVYKMLQEADTVGIFQVESRAQMATLPRLCPTCFYDIVVEVAIIRPGPIVGNMVHPYLKRRQGREPVTYPHPSLQPILQRTLGVPLFQEQLLRMAMVAAGFTGGEAEELRRAFGFKRSEKRMAQVEEKLRAGMTRQGITGDAAEQIIRSITSFALYGFPESHSASFALLVYASAYLKAHYPAAFFTAMLNNQPMGFYHPATLVKDAQRHGVSFVPIDVQLSDWECRVEPDGRVRLGLMYVNGLREEIGRSIETAGGRGVAGSRSAGSEESGSAIRSPWSESVVRAGATRQNEVESARSSTGCPKCGNDDESMLEDTDEGGRFCNVCAYEWSGSRCGRGHTRQLTQYTDPGPRTADRGPRTTDRGPRDPRTADRARFTSIEDLIARTRIRRDELATLAEIGALNAFGHDRRSALWQIERAARPAGELFAGQDVEDTSQAQSDAPPGAASAPRRGRRCVG